jgi:hypothetical protein
MQFFLCKDDNESCVKGTRQKWVISRSKVLDIRLVKIGTNLTRKEVLQLEDVGFHLPQREDISPKTLFTNQHLPMNLAAYVTRAFPDEFPNWRSGKNIRRNMKALTTCHYNNCASALTLEGQVQKVTMIPAQVLGCIVTLDSGTQPTVQQDCLTIFQLPPCTCPYFKEMATKALGKRGHWANCKHLNFVLIEVCGLRPEVDYFINDPSFSSNEVSNSGALMNM